MIICYILVAIKVLLFAWVLKIIYVIVVIKYSSVYYI